MVEIVFAEDQHRALRAEATLQQGLGDIARGRERLPIGDMAPGAGAAIGVSDALGQPGAIRASIGPRHQLVGHARGERLQRLLGFQITCAIGAFTEHATGHPEVQSAVLLGYIFHGLLQAGHAF